MNPALNEDMVNAMQDERIRHADRARLAQRSAQADGDNDHFARVTVRLAADRDEAAVHRLEELEGRRMPREAMLVAEVDGRILAARTLARRHAVADPSQPTAGLVELLDLRSVQLRQESGGRVGARRVGRFVRAVTAPIRS